MFRSFFTRIFQLFFPENCVVCNDALRYSERVLCSSCLLDIPRVYFHNSERNPLEDLLWGHIPYVRASSLFYYYKEQTYASLIYDLKYKNRPDIGVFLGELFAAELDSARFFDGIDYIVPIPLHKKRLRTRKYNQSEKIAEGLSVYSNIPIASSLIQRTIHTKTQTQKNKEERMRNVSNIFKVTRPQDIHDKHILLVDDIITTGATTISCTQSLLEADSSVRVSIVSLGLAR
ncbi:MAG: ComF family protein [Bacteroidales bacterium]